MPNPSTKLGRPLKFLEPTKNCTFRCPVSRLDEFNRSVGLILASYAFQAAHEAAKAQKPKPDFLGTILCETERGFEAGI